MGRKRKLVFESNTPGKVMKLSELWGHGKQAVQTEDALQEESRPADDVPEIADKPKSASVTKKVTRNFREQWKQGRPWLYYNNGTRGMFCTVCQRAQVKNNFSVEPGCTVLKHESITKHEAAKGKIISIFVDIIQTN